MGGGAPYLRVEGVASRPEGGWAAVLFFRDVDGGSLGSRDITSGAETCDSLAQAVVFAVALAIDPRVGLEADATTVRLADGDGGRGASPGVTGGDGRGTGQREAGEGDDARASGGAAEGGAPGAEGGAPGAEAGARAGGGDAALPGPSVVAGALVSAGTLPDSPGVGVALGVRGPVTLGWLSWGIGAFFFGPRENDDVGVSLAGAWAEVCVAGALADRVELRACPRFLGGGYVVYVRPGDIETSNPGAFSWLAAGVGLEGLVRIVGPLSVAVDVTPLVSLSRREFTAGGRDAPLFAEEALALMAHLGLAWVF